MATERRDTMALVSLKGGRGGEEGRRQKGLNHLCQQSTISTKFNINVLEITETNAINCLTKKSYRVCII